MFEMSETEVLTTEDLRNRMFEALKKRGLIDVLKVRRQTVVLNL